MAQEEAALPKRRRRSAGRPEIQFPIEVTLWYPGQKEPRKFGALWYRREQGADVFGLPEFQRPYMQRTLRVPDAAGVVVELVQMVQQFQQPQAPPPTPREAYEERGIVAPVQSVGGPGAVLRQEGFGAAPARPLRAVVGPAPASEVIDESGMRTVVPAAFGMAIP